MPNIQGNLFSTALTLLEHGRIFQTAKFKKICRYFWIQNSMKTSFFSEFNTEQIHFGQFFLTVRLSKASLLFEYFQNSSCRHSFKG